MTQSFALDLKVARKKSGLTQSDCAHLLDVPKSKICRLEQGEVMPSVADICTLSLLYGRTFESLFGVVFDQARKNLKARLATLPAPGTKWLGRFNRHSTLERLIDRLDAFDPSNHGSA